ncbi:hypothetical protein [Mucilaginibacter flavus]|uniref:hypothetical protein n=1 Tax=Mucilaginibacter flavus TaxID=931504 RepID=UPI0025B339D0|nr:hypothetical protein [Mucilaginibacter flavus]MDN3582124.1 hypothetical protein [Mucilaginibacter flavus]
MAILLYPIIVLFGIVVMLFVVPLSIWQKLTTSKAQKLENKKAEALQIEKENQWSVFFENQTFTIHQKIAGSLPWGSGDYIHLHSTPTIPYFDGKIWGEWFLVDFGGIFLQRWNHERNIDCDLVYISFDTLEVNLLKQNIPTKHWNTQKSDENEIEFTFSTNNSDITYAVQRPS